MELKFTEPEVVRKVYSLGRAVSKVCEETGQHYWTSGGTTLGAVRHGGLIPWDDDLDICILNEHEYNFKTKVVPVLEEHHNILCRETFFGHRLFHVKDYDTEYDDHFIVHHCFPFCDVFVMQMRGKHVTCQHQGTRSLYPQERYKTANIINPQLTKFGDFQLRIPKHPEVYLNRYYGKGWQTEAWTQNYSHTTKQSIKPKHFYLNDNLYQPAEPFQ